MNKEIPVFKPTKNNEENFLNLSDWAQTVGSMLGDDNIQWAGTNLQDSMYDIADRDITKHHDFGSNEYFYALYAKQNPEPYEYSEKYQSDVYDKKRKLFNTGYQQFQLDHAKWKKDRAKFVNHEFGMWFGQLSDDINRELRKHGIDGRQYGVV